MGFTWTDIAIVLNISRSTLYRRLKSSDLQLRTGYTHLSDNELDKIIIEIKTDHPNDGEVLIAAHHVPRSQLRASIHRTDPHVQDRLKHNHKLIRWRFVIHAGIDVYSRLIIFINCATNNQASTMLLAFEKGISDYGIPRRIRSDRGGENVDVWRFMLASNSSDSTVAPVIVGSSTHNERIERLWRDVHRCVLKPFADKFRELEELELFDPLNEIDVFMYVSSHELINALKHFKRPGTTIAFRLNIMLHHFNCLLLAFCLPMRRYKYIYQ